MNAFIPSESISVNMTDTLNLSPEVLAKYEIVIGLEVHCQLQTHTKIFASDANHFGSEPNTNISVITLAHPGTLPKLNKKAVEYAVRMGLACGCSITGIQFLTAKTIFIPTCPKVISFRRINSRFVWAAKFQ